MKNILNDFESNYAAQRDLMMLLQAMQNNDKERLNQIINHIKQGEPYKQHLQNLLDLSEN